MQTTRDDARRHELPIYPEVEVRVHSRRPLVLVSAVRYALRRAGIGSDQASGNTHHNMLVEMN